MASTVTVLFTDLVGSTALLSRVGEVAAEELRQSHFGLLRDAVEAHGGREVKNLGDGLMVVFSGAAQAVAAAVAMQQGFERWNRRATEPLLIRVGIAAGDADEAEGDVFGVPVVQAARLCAVADGGEILCSELARLLAGSRVEAVFESVGALELKGLDEPVPACRVVWEPAAAPGGVGLPARLAAALTGGFAGRHVEFERLVVSWKEAVGEAVRRVVLLSGEPGIGKTTLTARFAAEAHGEGALVVYGRCDEDLGVPYQPWIEALGQLIDVAPVEVLSDHVVDKGAHLARLVPALGRRADVAAPTTGDGDDDRFALFASVVNVLERVSVDMPVLVVLDDLHWADRQSLQLLRHVVTAGRPLRLMIVGTFRDSDVTAGDPMSELLAALHRESGVERVALQGLSDLDLLEWLERVAGHELDAAGVALRDAVLAETAGNPFFVGEILRHLIDTGAIYQDATGRWVGDADISVVGLPVSVKEVVGRRIGALGPDAERLLSHAAVIGRDFDVDLLAAVAGVDDDTVIDVCDQAVAASVLQTTDQFDRYTFAHALIEHTLYEGLSPSRRARVHRKVAEAIEVVASSDPEARAGELAHHWNCAVQPADAAKALHYTRLAGNRSLAALAPDEAVRWFTQALELLDRDPEADDRQRVEVLLGLGTAQDRVGVAANRQTLLDAAHLADSIDAVDLLVRAALANGRLWQSNALKVDDDRVAVLRLALERIVDDDTPERARLLATLAAELHYTVSPLDERMALAEEAVAVARQVGDTETLTSVLCQAANSTRVPATTETRRTWLTEAASIAATADPRSRARVEGELRLLALEEGDLAAYRRHTRNQEELDPGMSDAYTRWNEACKRVVPAILSGDVADAERVAEQALAIGTELQQPDAMRIYGIQASNIWFHQGRLGEFVDAVARAVDAMNGLLSYRAFYAMTCAHSEHADRATDILTRYLNDGFDAPDDIAWPYTFAQWADVAATTGHLAAAAALHQRMSPYPTLFPNAGCTTVMPVFAHWLGRLDHVLGRFDDADRWFTRADAAHHGLESPLLIAYSDAAWAALVADRNRGDDHQRARTLAERALAAATAGGYGYIEADARAVLQRLDDQT